MIRERTSPLPRRSRALFLRVGQQLRGVGQGFVGEVDPAEHARDFLDTLLALQVRYGGAGVRAAALLVHEQVLMPLCGDLRQVGHAQHLAAFAQAAQQLADHFGGRAADADVHLVEHQRRYARGLRGDDLDGQADA